MALHLARLFHSDGWRVTLADAPAYPLSAASASCAAYLRLPQPRFQEKRFGDAIEAFVEREKPDLVIPTCEEIFYLARIWQERSLPPVLFAPEADMLRSAHDKHAFIELCRRFGLEAPRTIRLESPEDLEAVCGKALSLVFKPVWSRFASRVLIRPSPDQARLIQPTPQAPWIAQDYLDGEELSVYAIAKAGRLITHSLYRSPYRAGKGAGIYFEPVEDQYALDFVARFVAGADWTGQISFDLMRLADGRVLPLECNPRATSGLHFFRNPQAFVRAVTSGESCARDVQRPQTSRLAMWIFGLPGALRSRSLPQFRRCLRAADEILDWPGDPAPSRAQWLALGEVALLALRHGISLQRASTRDIEWDGPDQRSI